MSQTNDSINHRFAEAASKYPEMPALSAKYADKETGKTKTWHTLKYKDVTEKMRLFSLGLQSLGVQPGDRVAMLSENRPEWAIADLATLAAGAVTVPIYPTLPPAQVAHILIDSGARAIIVSDAKQLSKVEVSRDTCPNLTIFVTMDDTTSKGDVLSFDAVLQEGAHADQALVDGFEARRDAVGPEDLMSIVYTSGTTGNPKGAMLSHRNICAALDGAKDAFPLSPPNETFLSFLPLCHVFERVTYCLALTLGAHTYYNDSIFKLLDNLAETKPTVMQCVPRIFETIHERVLDQVSKESERKQKIFHWAVSAGGRLARRKNAGKIVGPFTALAATIADKLVLAKIRARFGGNLHFFVSGGAPLNAETANFFNAIGIPIIEGWGLTETTGASTINPWGRAKVGTVGKHWLNTEVKTAPDGEILVRGKNVMSGYWNLPEATAEVIDADGWFHTGDIGEIDARGYVRITDRKKDILVLTNGKKVAPQPIETRIKQSPYITEIVLLGDKADSVSALVIPNFDKLKAWEKEQGRDVKSNEELVKDPAARKFIKTQVDQFSGELADFEKIKKIALLDKAFSVDTGELTPTLKVKRKVVFEKYGSLLDKGE